MANAARQQAQNFAEPAAPAARVTSDGVALPQEATAADLETDADLGEQWVLKNNERPMRFSVFADASLFHTTNIALASGRQFADSFLVATVGANYVRPIGGPWTLNASLSETLFRYERFSEFNFDSFNAGAGLSFQAAKLWNSLFSLQYNFTHLTQEGNLDQLFSGHSLSLTGSRMFQLTTADSFTFGATTAYNLAEPSSLQRSDLAVFATYNLAVTRSLSLSLSYRRSYFYYQNTSRFDANQALAAGLRLNLSRWFSLDMTVSGVANLSNRAAYDYHALNFGGGLSGTFRF